MKKLNSLVNVINLFKRYRSKNKVISSLFTVAALGMNPIASAETFRPLHNTWYETQIKQIISSAVDTLGGSLKTVKGIKFDTGNKNCYSHIWSAGFPFYNLDVYCLGTIGGDQAWEHDSFTVIEEFDPLDGSVGNLFVNALFFPPIGGSGHDTEKPEDFINFVGPLILKPKFNKNNQLKTVLLQTGKQGYAIYSDGLGVIGATPVKLKFKYINTSKILLPNELLDCALSYETNAHSIDHC